MAAFIDIVGLDGTTEHVVAEKVFRVFHQPAGPFQDVANTHIEYAGGQLGTLEPVETVIERLRHLQVKFAKLTSPGGQVMYLNPTAVTSIRTPLSREKTPNTNSIVIVGAQLQALRESVAEVQAALDHAV